MNQNQGSQLPFYTDAQYTEGDPDSLCATHRAHRNRIRLRAQVCLPLVWALTGLAFAALLAAAATNYAHRPATGLMWLLAAAGLALLAASQCVKNLVWLPALAELMAVYDRARRCTRCGDVRARVVHPDA